MTQKRSVWRELEESGGVAVMRKIGKVGAVKRPPGRPRIHPLGMTNRRKLAVGYKMRTPAGDAMRCRAKGCSNFIRKGDEALCCSAKCHEQLLDYCRVTLDVLEGRVPASEYPAWYRTRRYKRKQQDEAA